MAREITVTARILSGLGGRYTVLLRDPPPTLPPRIVCLAKGAFRHTDQKPLVGDLVTLRVDPDAPDDTAVTGSDGRAAIGSDGRAAIAPDDMAAVAPDESTIPSVAG